jgi:endonuclease/exonuclease/phosphatase family metal-dependent hydrolase
MTALLLVGLAAGSLARTVPVSAAVALPDRITSVSAISGPDVGQVTISWAQSGGNTTSFQIEGSLTTFSPSSRNSLARHGRIYRMYAVPAALRSVTLSAEQVAAAGAPVASGNMLYYRVFALNQSANGQKVRAYPDLRAVLPQPVTPGTSDTALRVATFNVRTARATGDARKWLTRAPDVAEEILSREPGVVALQELGPGRADGKTGSLKGRARQTTSLETALAKAGGSRYKLVRSTPYWAPRTKHDTQGTRILYDTNRFRLSSDCPEKTGKSNYSDSCTIVLPVRAQDSLKLRRIAAYARFTDKKTGKRFYVVTAHLDQRHSSNASAELSYDTLRGQQAKKIADAMDEINTDDLPVVIGGDFNSWQNNRIGNAPNETLVNRGYYDTASAPFRINLDYPTVNQFSKTLAPNSLGVGVRLDVIMVKGGLGAEQTENVTKPVDAERPSDHSLVVSDIVL